MPEAELRALMPTHGFKVVSLVYRLSNEGRRFEYRGVLSTLDESNVPVLSETLRSTRSVVKFRLASRGD